MNLINFHHHRDWSIWTNNSCKETQTHKKKIRRTKEGLVCGATPRCQKSRHGRAEQQGCPSRWIKKPDPAQTPDDDTHRREKMFLYLFTTASPPIHQQSYHVDHSEDSHKHECTPEGFRDHRSVAKLSSAFDERQNWRHYLKPHLVHPI